MLSLEMPILSHRSSALTGLILVALALFLSSCYVGMPKQEQTKNLLPTPTLDTSIEAVTHSPFFSIGDWPDENWWEIFGSPQLNTFIAEALTQNPTLEAIQKKVDVAKQEAIVTRSRLFPYVSFEGDIAKSYLAKTGLYRAFNPKLPLNVQLIELSLSFDYEFDFWGQNYNLFSASIGEVLANRAEEAQLRLIVTTSVAQAYFGLKANLLRKQLYERLLEATQGVLDLQRSLQSSALSSKLDPLLFKEDVLEVMKSLAAIENEILVAKHWINALMGRGADESICVDASMPPLPSTISVPDNLTLDLIARRPDLMAQIWRAKALAYQVGAAMADFYPDVSFKALAGYESVFFYNFFNKENRTYTVKPAFHLPIFTAGAIEANVQAHRAAFDEAIYAYNQLILTSIQEVADILSFAQSIFEQKVEQDSIISQAQERLWLTTERKKAGLDSRFEELGKEVELIDKEIENVTLLYGQYLAAVKLIKALGGGYYTDYCVPLVATGECR